MDGAEGVGADVVIVEGGGEAEEVTVQGFGCSGEGHREGDRRGSGFVRGVEGLRRRGGVAPAENEGAFATIESMECRVC